MTKSVSKLASAPEKSPLQQQAEAEAVQFRRAVYEYRDLLPANLERNPADRGGVCRADGWNISRDWLDGDYDLDDAVARQLIGMLINPDPAGKGPMANSLPSAADVESSWLHDYFNGTTSGLTSEIKSATVGPGNVLANANSLVEARHASVVERTTKAIQAAAGDIANKRMRSVKINDYMTVYNGNTSGKGRPRPKLKITRMPIQVVTPALGTRVSSMSRGAYNGKLLVNDALKKQAGRMGALAGDSHWSGLSFRDSSLRGKIGGGVLTFGPTAAIDAMQSIDRDVDGRLGFNGTKFTIASARSQSGNAVGWAAGKTTVLLTEAFVVAGVFTLSAPAVVLVGLVAGLGAAVLWNVNGGPNWAEHEARQILER